MVENIEIIVILLDFLWPEVKILNLTVCKEGDDI